MQLDSLHKLHALNVEHYRVEHQCIANYHEVQAYLLSYVGLLPRYLSHIAVPLST